MWNHRQVWIPIVSIALLFGANVASADTCGEKKQVDTKGAGCELDEGAETADGEQVQGEAQQEDEQGETLIYSVNRTPERLFDTARAAQVITIQDIWRRNARTLPEVLMEETGLFVQQTNYGGGSPFIRGLKGKQILILMDGVRVNNTTYRFGPVQYLATINLNLVDRVEVVRGVGSVLGSDALGGVINIITKKGPPPGAEQSVGVAVQTRFSTADSAGTGHVETFGRGEKFRYFGGMTYQNTDDVVGGGDIGTQAGTGYDERAGSFSFEYYPSFEKTISVGYHDVQQNEVPRTDRLDNGRNLVFNFNPQKLQLLRVAYQDITDRGWSNSVNLTGYLNAQTEGRQEIRSSAPDTERLLNDDQRMLGFNLDVGSQLGQSHRLLYGVELIAEEITSLRDDTNLLTGAVASKRGRYTDGATQNTFGIYLQDRLDVGELLTLTLGARYSRFTIGGSEDSSVGQLDLDSTNQATTGSASAVFHVSPGLNLIGSVTRGFRAPNIDDVAVFDARNSGIEVPNPEVGPERIASYEGGVKFATTRLSGSAFYYHTRLTDLLLRTGGTFNGLPFFDLNGNGIQEAAEVAVLQKQNIGEGTIDGLELDGGYVLRPGFRVYGNLTWTVGDDTIEDIPLRRIPPVFGTVGFRWSQQRGRRPWTEIVYHFAGSQTRLSPGDISDSRIGPEGTDAFNVFNVRSGLSLAEMFRFTVSVENLFDEAYKYHGSGIFRPGRQLVVGMELRF